MPPEYERVQEPRTTAEFIAARADIQRSTASAAQLVVDGGLDGEHRQRVIRTSIVNVIDHYQQWHAHESLPGGLIHRMPLKSGMYDIDAEPSLARLFSALSIIDLEKLRSASPGAFMYEFSDLQSPELVGVDADEVSSRIRRVGAYDRMEMYYKQTDILLGPIESWKKFREHDEVKNTLGDLVDEAENSQYEVVCDLALKFDMRAIDTLPIYPRETTVALLSAMSTALGRSTTIDDKTKEIFTRRILRTLQHLSKPELSKRLGKYGRFASDLTGGSLLPFADPDFADSVHSVWDQRDDINTQHASSMRLSGDYDLMGYCELVEPLIDQIEAEIVLHALS